MNHPNLTKVCMVCGEQKPLTAFVQLKVQGGIYGSTCGSCQKSEAEKAKIPPKDIEGETTSSTGFQIDSKSRVQEQTDKREHHQHIQELDHENRKKKDELRLDKIQKIETIAKDEKKHRENILKTNLFSDKKNEILQKAAAKQEQIQQTTKETFKRAHDAFEEKKRSTLDFSVAQTAPTVAGDARYQNASIRTFCNFLGKSAPLTQALEQFSKTQSADKKEKDGSPSAEFIEKNWGPSSRRR